LISRRAVLTGYSFSVARIYINNIKRAMLFHTRAIYFSPVRVKDLRFPRLYEAEIFHSLGFGKLSEAFPQRFFELLLIDRHRGHVT
jgi:hypothetical protein